MSLARCWVIVFGFEKRELYFAEGEFTPRLVDNVDDAKQFLRMKDAEKYLQELKNKYPHVNSFRKVKVIPHGYT